MLRRLASPVPLPAPVDVLIDYQAVRRPLGTVTIAPGCGGDCRMRFDATQIFPIAQTKGWRSARIPHVSLAISRLVLTPSEGGTT